MTRTEAFLENVPQPAFRLVSTYQPAGDQPKAINSLIEGLESGELFQTLLGVTGSGKTFTVANIIEITGRPAIILAPNKTLAAQLYSEMREFFPDNAVEYFVSYYDYYQPEAYVPSSDTYIEKDGSVNDHIDQITLRSPQPKQLLWLRKAACGLFWLPQMWIMMIIC